jgi:hypothetical protein
MSDKKFVFMVLEEHPYGREMLMQLMNAGHIPMAIIEEASNIAEEEKEKFLERIKGHRVAPTFIELLEGKDIPRYKVPHHKRISRVTRFHITTRKHAGSCWRSYNQTSESWVAQGSSGIAFSLSRPTACSTPIQVYCLR